MSHEDSNHLQEMDYLRMWGIVIGWIVSIVAFCILSVIFTSHPVVFTVTLVAALIDMVGLVIWHQKNVPPWRP